METQSLPPNVSPMKASGWRFCGDSFWSTWEKILPKSPPAVWSPSLLPVPAPCRVYRSSERGRKRQTSSTVNSWKKNPAMARRLLWLLPENQGYGEQGAGCPRTQSWTLIPPGSPWHPCPRQGWSWTSSWSCPRKVPAPWCGMGGVEVVLSHSSHSFPPALALPLGCWPPFLGCPALFPWGTLAAPMGITNLCGRLGALVRAGAVPGDLELGSCCEPGAFCLLGWGNTLSELCDTPSPTPTPCHSSSRRASATDTSPATVPWPGALWLMPDPSSSPGSLLPGKREAPTAQDSPAQPPWSQAAVWVPRALSQVGTGGRLGHSDHKSIEFQTSDKRKRASKTSARGMRRADFRLLRELVSRLSRDNGFAGAGVHPCWSSFETSPPKGTAAGDSQMSEAKQERQKSSSLAKRMEKEAVCPVEARSQEEYRDVSCHCREKFGAVKAQLERTVTRNVRHNKKSVFKYISGKKHCRSNIVPFQDVDGHHHHKQGQGHGTGV